MPKADTEKLFSIGFERASNRVEMPLESKRAEPLGKAGMFKKMASTVRQSMARCGPRRILVVAVFSVGLVAALVAVTIISTRPTDGDDLQMTDSTIIVPPSPRETIGTDNVPRVESTTKYSTTRGSSRVTISSTRLTVPAVTTSRVSASKTSVPTTSEATTTITPVPAMPEPEIPTTDTQSVSSASESTTTSRTETTVDIPTTDLPLVTTATIGDSVLTTPIWPSELNWTRFLDSELSTECDCKGCKEAPDREYLFDDEVKVDRFDQHLLFFIERTDRESDLCVIIKSMPSAYSTQVDANKDIECEYNFDKLREYYVRFPRLKFPTAKDNIWGINDWIVGQAQFCGEVIALKQCEELPKNDYFGTCK